MRMRPAAKLVLILIVFAVVLGTIYIVKTSGLVKPAQLPDLPQVSKDVAKVETETVSAPSVQTPVEPTPTAPQPVQTPIQSNQEQNTGLSKLLQSGKR